jgi:cytochrome c-type biogenesis protein CcmF
MLAEIGLIALILAFFASVYAAVVALYGARRGDAWVASARNAAVVTFPLLFVSCGALLAALLNEQYQISYVWTTTNPSTPMFYRLTALWGSQRGSLLFWNLLVAAFACVAILLHWRAHRRLMPYVIAFSMASLAFFVGLSLFLENPFARYWITPEGGVIETVFTPAGVIAPLQSDLASSARGLNPLLRHFGMIIHPPMLYLGFIGFLVPCAFAVAALASGELSSNWIKATRRWTLVAWLFLSLGLILGGRWAYDVLGWGGYWGWDPVENAAFIPWLIGTAFLHSVMIQEKRGMLKVWNMVLVVFTFSAVVFGTFATRSGLIDSVHAFAQSQVGTPMFLFWAAVTLVSVALIVWRYQRGELRSERAFAGLLSRESLFVLNNVVFVALALAIFWGSFGAPLLTELTTGVDITLGADYFLPVTAPLFAVMYILMGVAPVAAWGAMSLRTMGRAMIVPFLITGAALAAAFVLGARTTGSLFAYGVVLLAGSVALYEIYRGGRARARVTREHLALATARLFARNHRRYGGLIVHLGIVIIGLGVIGSTLFQTETQRTIRPGESVEFAGYTLTYQGADVGQIAEDGRVMDIANLSLARDGQALARLRPRHDVYPTAPDQQAMLIHIPSAYSTLENDYYVLLTGLNPDASATFKIYVNPLINLVWWGGLVLIVGTVLSTWKDEKVTATERRSARTQAAAPAGAPS